MRLLVLNHEFPPVGGGGARAAEDICRGLSNRGFEISVLTAHLNGLAHDEERDGYRILRLSSLRTEPFRAGLLPMAAYVLAGLWAGSRLTRRFQPDAIHAHFAVPAGALAWVLSRLAGIPYVLTVHLGDVPGAVPEKTGKWFRWIYPLTGRIWRDASRIVAVSEFTKQLALEKYDAEIRVIPNGVDLDSQKSPIIRLNDPPRIVFAGRFMPQKNPMQVIQTLDMLKDLPWQCVMIGDGPLMPDVRRAVVNLGLEDRVQFTGWVDPEDVTKWFAISDILFMPSRSEGLPVVGVQALVHGLAVVAGCVGGFVDLVQHGQNGYLVLPESLDDFSSSLRSLLSDPSELLSFRKASLAKAESFDIERVVREYENLFLSISEGKHLA